MITQLANSPNYRTTHKIIENMKNKISHWTENESVEICKIAEENTQVKDILADDDVLEFYRNIVSIFQNKEMPDVVKRINEKTQIIR